MNHFSRILIFRRFTRDCNTKKSTHLKNIPEGLLVGFGNPLLDITKFVKDNAILQKYGLSENAAINAEEKHLPLFEELKKMDQIVYSAGGSCQNTMRVFQWIVAKPFCACFVGTIGNDKFGDILLKRATCDGVRAILERRHDAPTGTCAVIVNGLSRTLVANVGAASLFSKDWLDSDANVSIIRNAQYFYTTGFFIKTNAAVVLHIAKLSSENSLKFVLNLGAVFVMQTLKTQIDEILQYTDIVIGNKQELLAFADTHDWNTTDIVEIGRRFQCLPRKNRCPRIVIITDSMHPIMCFQQNEVCVKYPVPKVDNSVIVDTNGCGDAFAGGFLSQLVYHRPLSICIRTGIYASQQVLQIVGMQIEKLPKFNESYCPF